MKVTKISLDDIRSGRYAAFVKGDTEPILASEEKRQVIDTSDDIGSGCPHCGSYEGDWQECPECGHGQ